MAPSRFILIFCFVSAVLVGLLLTSLDTPTSIGMLVCFVMLLAFPLIAKWYHPLLVATWNAAITPYFIPGSPYLWMIFAVVGLVVAMVQRAVYPERKFLPTHGVSVPLIVLALLVLATAVSGGLGARILGSDVYGGKKCFYILASIVGFFVLVSQPIPVNRAKLYVALFFFSGVTALISNFALLGGEKFYFLYYLFPVSPALYQLSDISPGMIGISRIGGGLLASTAIVSGTLALYGMRGVLDLTRPWRFCLFAGGVMLAMLSGFRISLLYIGLAAAIMFVLEGLHKSMWLLVAVAVLGISALLVLPNTERLPLAMQRSLCWLPVKVDPLVRRDAEYSLLWRVRMWEDLLPEARKHIFWGKGFAINADDWHFAFEHGRRGGMSEHELAMISGDYHNGILALVIPLGIWGLLSFIWFIVVSIRVLYKNWRYGPECFRTINCALLAFFLTHSIIYFAVFGAPDLDFYKFTGLVGLGIALNGAVDRGRPRKPNSKGGVQSFAGDADLVHSAHEMANEQK